MHLAYIRVGYSSPFVGKKLIDSDMRRRYGVNVASIQRGGELIAVPNGNERLFPGDVIGVIGTDELIEELLPVVEMEELSHDNQVSDMKLTSIHLSETSPLIGQTSASAQIRDRYKALIVAIQHSDGSFDHPTGSTVFYADDVLWMVGDPKILKNLK